MLRPAYGLRTVFGTARGVRSFAANTLAAFGLVATVVQLGGQLLPAAMPGSVMVLSTAAVSCTGWGILRAYPRARFTQALRYPHLTVTVEVGDIVDCDADLVIGFCDTFDTTTDDDLVINRSSLQGQVLHRLYDADTLRLDRELSNVLTAVAPAARESQQEKPKGKLLRYPLGTVAVLTEGGRRIYAVAYSRMGNDYVARSSVDDLWWSLDRLWDAIHRHGQRRRLAIPLLGAVLARIDALDPASLLKMTLLSFTARSRQQLLCNELRIVIHPADLDKVNLLELAAFLHSL